MLNRLRPVGRRALKRVSTATSAHVGTHAHEIEALRRRVAELEAEMQESRRLNRRLAELTDVVQELLVPVAQRDEEKLREYLARYAASL
jgi:DNA repair exonuclease SbcCD ATPase subunit